MSKTQTPNPRIYVPLTPAQKRAVKRAAKAEGLTMAGWLRQLVLATLRDLA